jgi:YVTN family beta-propeller protein
MTALLGAVGLFATAGSQAAAPAMPNMPNMPGMPNMAMPPAPPPASGKPILVPDPTKVVIIVNRDSNDIGFMDIATKKMIGRTFLGNNVNPHMAMMSPDGRYVVTGGQRSSKAYIIDARTLELVKIIPVGLFPEHLNFSPDGRYYWQGNPEGDSISIIDMQSLSVIKTIEGLVEPLNITFTTDGTKAYVGNYGAHFISVVDTNRLEVIKKIQVDQVPGIARLDPSKYLSEIKGNFQPVLSADGRYIYTTDGDLGIMAVIDTREDRVVKVIRIGKDPWRMYMSHDGKYGITVNNGDETISIIDLTRLEVVATLEGPPDMTGVNFAAGKAFVIGSTSGFEYVYDMTTLRPAGRIKIGQNLQIQTATTDLQDRKIYLASATDNSVYILDGQTEQVERVPNVGLFPWGTHIMDSKDNYCH